MALRSGHGVAVGGVSSECKVMAPGGVGSSTAERSECEPRAGADHLLRLAPASAYTVPGLAVGNCFLANPDGGS